LNIDIHRHLGGSIGPECVWKIIKNDNLTFLAQSLEEVNKSMSFQNNETHNFQRFLQKFKILDNIEWNEENIALSIKSVCDGLKREKIDICWLDFSINKYMRLKWHKKEAIKFIYDRFKEYTPCKIGLMLSLKYESLRRTQIEYAKLIEDPEVRDMIIGIDLVGDEQYFDHTFYKPIFKEWKKHNKILRAHVGESQSAVNVYNAIHHMHITNIAHGIKCYSDEDILSKCKHDNISFDMAITSNYVTKSWIDKNFHPFMYMLENENMITIGSDDPVQCNTTLENELKICSQMLKDHHNYNRYKIDKIINNAYEVVKPSLPYLIEPNEV